MNGNDSGTEGEMFRIWEMIPISPRYLLVLADISR